MKLTHGVTGGSVGASRLHSSFSATAVFETALRFCPKRADALGAVNVKAQTRVHLESDATEYGFSNSLCGGRHRSLS